MSADGGTAHRAPGRGSLGVIYATVALDSVGIGIVFPILPRLLADLTHIANIAPYVGVVAALYATMQFLFAPLLGALSDRFGRRPVLLASVGGAAVDYIIMAFAPSLWMLMLGRALAGLCGANAAVAAAYLTDVTPEVDRPRRFGLLGAMTGAGFILGPVLGGLLSDWWLRLPFVAAAALNAGILLLALVALPESRRAEPTAFRLRDLNPIRPLRAAVASRTLRPVFAVYFLLAGAGEAYGVCWALWGHDVFGWNGLWIGLSLAAFGICETLVQATLPGPMAQRLGEGRAVVIGIVCTCLALALLAFATRGWVVFALMPLFALGGIGTPAFQALATAKAPDDQQGQLQGSLASTVSLASILAPLGFSASYAATQSTWPGAVWLTVVLVNLLAIPLVYASVRPRRRADA